MLSVGKIYNSFAVLRLSETNWVLLSLSISFLLRWSRLGPPGAVSICVILCKIVRLLILLRPWSSHQKQETGKGREREGEKWTRRKDGRKEEKKTRKCERERICGRESRGESFSRETLSRSSLYVQDLYAYTRVYTYTREFDAIEDNTRPRATLQCFYLSLLVLSALLLYQNLPYTDIHISTHITTCLQRQQHRHQPLDAIQVYTYMN